MENEDRKLHSQAVFLITRMLDEMVAMIISVWGNEKEGIGLLGENIQGEYPEKMLEFMEKHFDAYKHLEIKEFLINMGSTISELIRNFGFEGAGEFAVLWDYLKQNVDNINYMGSTINRIKEQIKEGEDPASDFH